MKSYLRFLGKTLGRKPSPYLITIFSIAFVALLTSLIIKNTNESFAAGKALESISTFDKFGPFLFATLYASIIITHVFKEGEQDGSELIIVAKPLTRKEILIAKFLMTIFMLILYQLIMLLAYFFIALGDQKATWEIRINWMFSLFLGGIIIQLIVGSVIMLLSAVMSKVGTIVVSILVAALTPIISYTLSPLAKGQAFELDNSNTIKKLHGFNMGKYVENDFSSTINAENVYNYINNETNFDNYQKNRWYDQAAYFDIWYQWGRFYSIFTSGNKNDFGLVQKWEKDEVKIEEDNFTFMLNNIPYVYLIEKNASVTTQNFNLKISNIIQKSQLLLNDPSFEASIKAENNFFNQLALIADNNNIDVEFSPTNQDLLIPIYQYLQNQWSLETNDLTGGDLNNWNIYQNQSLITNVITASDYISSTTVIIIWSVIAIILIGGTIWLYSKRDFK